jgi:hypothetical protein
MHPLSSMKTGIQRNSRFSIRYFHGYYRIVTPGMVAIYRPTTLPVNQENLLHAQVHLRTAR